MNTYKCEDCGHEVLAEKQPAPIRWTDGHVCHFQIVEVKPKVDPFNKSFNAEYELAKKTGDARFGSPCDHSKVRDGYCSLCGRKVR